MPKLVNQVQSAIQIAHWTWTGMYTFNTMFQNNIEIKIFSVLGKYLFLLEFQDNKEYWA